MANVVADTVIAGGGTAGCVLAARLSEDPDRRVVVVEAGPDYPTLEEAPAMVRYGWGGPSILDDSLDLDWAFVARGSAGGDEFSVPRGRLIGGSGAINGQIFLRGLPEDFEAWTAFGGSPWGWNALSPVFAGLEAGDVAGRGSEARQGSVAVRGSPAVGGEAMGGDRHRSPSGPFRLRRWKPAEWAQTQAAFHAAALAAGYPAVVDHNAPDAMGVGALPFNQVDQFRLGPQLAYLTAEVRSRPNLKIRSHTTVLKLDLRDNRAIGVHVAGPDGKGAITAGEVIVACGAIGTAHLLLLSGIGPAASLRTLGVPVVADVPAVGRNLRDHPKNWIEWRLRDGVALPPDGPGLQLSLRYTATRSPLRGDMMLYPNSVVPGPETGSQAFRIEVVNNLEISSGEVRLRSASPSDPPEIDFGFFREGFDRERLADGVRRTLILGETEPLRGLLGERLLPTDAALASVAALDAWLERTVMTGHHASSTCRMGLDGDEGAVVDPSGRVRGIAALRIVDASIMPDSVRANIQATVLALAEILAARIRAGA